jgi:C-terminal processing protease CtpA/Prc
VVFLTDASAISYAESCMSVVESLKLGEIVGQTTAGTNGNINQLTLPGGYTVIFTGMRVTKDDGSVYHGVGVTPQHVVEPTIAGIKAGRDEQLDKAVELATPKP